MPFFSQAVGDNYSSCEWHANRECDAEHDCKTFPDTNASTYYISSASQSLLQFPFCSFRVRYSLFQPVLTQTWSTYCTSDP